MNNSTRLVREFHHPGIVVPDLEPAIAFYREFISYELVRSRGSSPGLMAVQHETG